MPELTKKLDRFTAAVLAEATAESEKTLSEVRVKRAAAFDEAEDRILLEAYHYIRGEVARIKAESGLRVSRHMLENKRELCLRREAISREVFAQVKDRIAAFTAGEEYPGRLTRLLGEALDQLSGAEDTAVSLRPADMALVPRLEQAFPGAKLTFTEGGFTLGGLTAQSAALGRRVDATFDSALDDLSGRFAEIFGLSLADGAEETDAPPTLSKD